MAVPNVNTKRLVRFGLYRNGITVILRALRVMGMVWIVAVRCEVKMTP